MTFSFSKYSGCGNDFILIDDREETFLKQASHLVAKMCDRRMGIGADGVVLLQKSSKADFRMRIINPDGSEAEMCGNGIRCLMKFIQETGQHKPVCTIESLHGIHTLILENEGVRVEMGDPEDFRWNIEVDSTVAHFINTGVPHTVEFVTDIGKVDIGKRGAFIRNHPLFAPKGTNYNAASIDHGKRLVLVRTFERGVEAETLACGTGATAAALAAAKIYGLESPIIVQTKSNETLEISFQFDGQCFDKVWMAGPAQKIYGGKAEFNGF